MASAGQFKQQAQILTHYYVQCRRKNDIWVNQKTPNNLQETNLLSGIQYFKYEELT